MAFRQEIAIVNDLACLAEVRDLVHRAVQGGRFPEQYLNRLQIAVDEAVTNIIEHGYEDRPRGSAKVEVRVDADPDRFRIEIIDMGATFDPNESDDIDIRRHVENGRAGGLGVFLMRKIMDVVDYHHETGRHNRLVMIKHRA